MVVSCEIEFDKNPQGTFYAGQALAGKVTIGVDHAKQVNGITLNISGFAHTRWTESESRTVTDSHGHSKTETTSSTYTGHETYIETRTFLLGSEESRNLVLDPGVHIYTFVCHIPHLCPSSFEGIYGHIRYKIKVVLIRPWKFDQSFTKGFTVLRILDLNYESPLLKMQASSSAEKIFCCGPCKSGPLKITATVPQGGYVPGQRIPISLLICNESREMVKEAKLTLCMLVSYRSQFPSTHHKSQRLTVSKIIGVEAVPRFCNKLFNYQLEVPATPPTCANFCRLIQVDYNVEVEAKMSGMSPNQVICVPVTIGNVPLVPVNAIEQQPSSSTAAMQRALMDAANADASVASLKALDTQSIAPQLDTTSNYDMTKDPWSACNIPMAYHEAPHTERAAINENEENDYGETDFAPKYPVFNVASPTASSME